MDDVIKFMKKLATIEDLEQIIIEAQGIINDRKKKEERKE